MDSPEQTIQVRKDMIRRWEISGKSIFHFCKEEHISYHLFHYWRKKLGKETQPQSTGFIKLGKNNNELSQNQLMEVVLSNGNRISFYQVPDADFIKRLVL